MPRGRKRKEVVAENIIEAPVMENNENSKLVEQLYSQFESLMKKKKVSKRDLAERISMSYQGFLNSYNNKNIKIDTWLEISNYLNTPFVVKFETGKKPAESVSEEIQQVSATQAPEIKVEPIHVIDDLTNLKLQNANEKVSILEKQVEAYERIINLLSDKLK